MRRNLKRNKTLTFLAIVVLLLSTMVLLYSGATKQQVEKKVKVTEHEVEMEDGTCLECHKEETPEIYNQWTTSAHGVALVKCYVCHGDKDNFTNMPDQNKCLECHFDQVENQVDKTKKCADCHNMHSFTQHRKADYNLKLEEVK